MGFQKKLLYFLVAVLVIGCSKDDNPPLPETGSKIPDFSLIGEDTESIFQYNYNVSLDEGEIINITQEDNVNRQYISIRQVDEVLTFYSFSSGSFSAVQRNTITGGKTTIANFHTVTDERSIIWGTNSDDKLFLGFYGPKGSGNYGIRTIDPVSREGEDLMIEFNVKNVFQPLYSSGKLVLVYQGQNDEYKAAIMDTDANSILMTINFGSSGPSIFIDGNGDIAVISAMASGDFDFSVYDFVTLELIGERSFSLNRLFPPGPLDAELVDEKLYYLYEYAQPSSIPFGPAVYNFASAQNNIIDMVGIVRDVEQELKTNISLSAFGHNAESNIFLMGFLNADESEILQGGVLVISDNGELLDIIELPFAPTYFIK